MRRIAISCLLSAVILLPCGLCQAAETLTETTSFTGQAATRRLPAEFERQDAMLLSWSPDDEVVQKTHLEVVTAAWKTVQFVFLIADAESLTDAVRLLRSRNIPTNAVRFVHVPFDTIWARDYGPMAVRTLQGTAEFIDADYERGERPNDDKVPVAVAPLFSAQRIHAPVSIEGGNLLSNGAGLCLTTESVFDQNLARGYTREELTNLLKQSYAADQFVFLEPLDGEPTGHVDMFATFTAVDTVVVGSYTHAQDAVNSEILDRNAERLSHIRTVRGPLRVVRIPMPERDDDVWRTYTNVMYANGTLVVPTYPGLDPLGRQQSLEVYRQLLPQWNVVDVDCGELIELGGAIHCISLNLCKVTNLPSVFPAYVPNRVVDLDEAVTRLSADEAPGLVDDEDEVEDEKSDELGSESFAPFEDAEPLLDGDGDEEEWPTSVFPDEMEMVTNLKLGTMTHWDEHSLPMFRINEESPISAPIGFEEPARRNARSPRDMAAFPSVDPIEMFSTTSVTLSVRPFALNSEANVPRHRPRSLLPRWKPARPQLPQRSRLLH